MQDPTVTGEESSPGNSQRLDDLFPEQIYEAIVRDLPDMTVFVFDHDLRYRVIQGTAFRELGWEKEDLLGRSPAELMTAGAAHATALEDAMRDALRGWTRVVEVGGVRRAETLWHNTVSPLRSTDGTVIGGFIVSRNLERLKRAEEDLTRSERETARWSERAGAERRLRERLEFLTGIDAVLARCRDRRQIMREVTAAAVPRLGDCCSIHMLMDPHDKEPVAEVCHSDPDLNRAARELLELFPYDPAAPFGIARVIRTGTPILTTGIDLDALERAGAEAAGLEPIRQLNLTSSLIVPLGVGERVVGALTFSVSGHDRELDADDVTLAQALAGRVAVSMENRRLSDVQRHIAWTLQRSLLPASLPDVPGVELAVRYWAAGEGSEVGGDFYDVFDTGHGTHAVVIGDVCGNGPAAAAVTASARHTIRALARRGDDHVAVLEQLNDAMLTTWPEVFCTVAYGTLKRVEGAVRLSAVSGGHPLPVMISAGGDASTLGRPGTLIGAFPKADPQPYYADLREGDTVVFYTDGAYDLPPPHNLSDGELSDLFAQAARAGADAESVADGIALRLRNHAPFEERDDDVAVVVLRITGELPQA